MEPETFPDSLSSEVGVDYTQLRDLLRAGKWREADEETVNVMLKVSKREAERWLQLADIENFPCTDLRTIDQLWVKHSNGRFGFSVQKRIWEEEETLSKFSERVGWRRNQQWLWLYYDDLTFTIQAPVGHLPARWGSGRGGWVGCEIEMVNSDCRAFRREVLMRPALAQRLLTCGI